MNILGVGIRPREGLSFPRSRLLAPPSRLAHCNASRRCHASSPQEDGARSDNVDLKGTGGVPEQVSDGGMRTRSAFLALWSTSPARFACFTGHEHILCPLPVLSMGQDPDTRPTRSVSSLPLPYPRPGHPVASSPSWSSSLHTPTCASSRVWRTAPWLTLLLRA